MPLLPIPHLRQIMPDEPELVLHVWPGRWDLPTFTPSCLASVLYLQLAIPGQFVVEGGTNPDVSPDGQLPFLSHGLVSISSFPSIVKYVDGLHRPNNATCEGDGDGSANAFPQEAQNRENMARGTAWIAYVSAHLGDLVACSLFTLRHNYYDFVRPALSELFPVPQRYYVPNRIRRTYKSRLEAVGLWSISAEEAEEEKRKKKNLGLAGHDSVKEAFGKEKVLDKAQTTLDILSRLLGDKQFFLDSPKPTPLDALIAAHILLLTVPPFPNDLLRKLVTKSYPSLVAHAGRLQSRTLSAPGTLHELAASMSSSFEVVASQAQTDQTDEEAAPLCLRSAPKPSLSELIPSLVVPFSWGLGNPFSSSEVKRKSDQDREHEKMRWAWFGVVAITVAAWVWTTGSRFEFVPSQSEEEQNIQGSREAQDREDGRI